MIPRAHLTHWRSKAPWPADAQVEQDLVLSRALVELFQDSALADSLAFRGGTALHKLCFAQPGRYSEDLDFVQRTSGPIGPIFDAIRRRLEPWLGAARTSHGQGTAAIVYRFDTTSLPVQRMRVKIEIQTREHFAVFGARNLPFVVESPWFSGAVEIPSFALEELLATKLRALYQRKKGRDLYDLELALTSLAVDDAQVVACLAHYLAHSRTRITRAAFEANMEDKLADPAFVKDVAPLLRDPESYDAGRAAQLVRERLLARLPGE